MQPRSHQLLLLFETNVVTTMPKGTKRPRNVGRSTEGLNLADPRWEQPAKWIGLPPHIYPKFQLFTVPPIDETVASCRVVEIPPLVTGQINSIEFEIKPSTEYVDLSKSFFMLKLPLKLGDGNNITNGTSIFPSQNLCHTMLKQVSVYVSGVLTTVQSDTYALSAMIQTILNHDEDDARSILRLQGFMPNNLNVPNPFTANRMNIKANAGAGYGNFQNLPMRQQAAVRAMVEEKNYTCAECDGMLVFKPLV